MELDARIERSFYARDALVVARALIGTYLVVTRPHDRRDDAAAPGRGDRVRAARIVETEAYRGPKDLACHARVGLTKRTKTLYGPPGHAYVFLIYGMYDCFNVVCFGEGKGHAVLVRAAEPVLGTGDVRTDGPGRLTRALGITRAHDAEDLVTGTRLHLAPRTKRPRIAVTARVGVAYAGAIAEAPWRFLDAGSRHVSRPPAKQIGLGLKAAR
ncbi:MAG TPA: DNA-3-methyladenine glycosylase [Labilithrix sp.]